MAEPPSPGPRISPRKEVISAHKEGGGGIAAVFPIHYPRALFRAFGLLPIEVWGPPNVSTAEGDAHLQAYTCSIVRGGLSFLLTGGLDIADVVVVPHACDSLQGLGSVLIDFVDVKQPVLTVYNPRGGTPVGARRTGGKFDGHLNTNDSATRFLAAEIEHLYEQLAEITKTRPDDGVLMEAIEREEVADEALAKLLASRKSVYLSERRFYEVVRSREFLPSEEFTRVALEVLEYAKTETAKGIPILLSGLVPEPMAILDALDDAGAVVAADDMACAGRRLYPRGTSDKPFERMAQRLMGAPPDSTRGSVIQDRIDHLCHLAKESGAKAVVFFLVKFCEPELFYLPQIREGLDAVGLKSVVVEADVTDPLPHQAITRVEALLETIA